MPVLLQEYLQEQLLQQKILEKAEKAEGAVTKLGFKDFRVRIIGNTGKLQVKPEQMQKAIELRKEILEAEKGILDDVVLDLKER